MIDANSFSAAALHSVPIEIRVCVGRARPLLGEMMSLQPDAILPLDSRLEDKVTLCVGDKVIATGELVELDGERAGQLAVRITNLADSPNAIA